MLCKLRPTQKPNVCFCKQRAMLKTGQACPTRAKLSPLPSPQAPPSAQSTCTQHWSTGFGTNPSIRKLVSHQLPPFFYVVVGAFVLVGTLWLALRLFVWSISSLMATILNSPSPDRRSGFKTPKLILPKSSFVRDSGQAVPSVCAMWFE